MEEIPELLECYTNGSVQIRVYQFDENSLGVSLSVEDKILSDACAFHTTLGDRTETSVVVTIPRATKIQAQ